MAIQAGSIEIELRAKFDNFREGLAKAGELAREEAEHIKKSASGIGDAFNGIGDKAKQEFKELSEGAIQAFDKADASAQNLHQTLDNIGVSLKSISFGALKAGATAATASLVKMAKAGIADTSALENTQIQMIGLTHSITAGNKAMAMAVQYYKNNPFNRFEVTDATKNLIQFGATLEDIPNLLDQLGKVSLSTGAKIDQLAYIYQRMISDGRVNTLDLLQLQTQGVNIFGALAEQLHTTSGGVRELVAEGKVGVEEVKEAFKSLVDDDAMEQFQQTLARQVDRAKGRLSDLRGAIAGYFTDENSGVNILEGGIYKSWTKFLKTFADIMTSTGPSATPAAKSIIEGFQKISVAIGGIIDKLTNLVEPALKMFGKLLQFVGENAELLIPIAGAALLSLTQVSSMLPVIGPIIQKVSGTFGQLGTNIKVLVKNHWGLITVVGILAKGFIEAYKTDEAFRKSIQELFQAIGEIGKSLGEIVRTVLPTFIDLFKSIATSDAVKGILQAVAGALSGIAKAIASIPPDNLAMIITFFASFKLLKTNPILLAVSAIALLIAYIKQLADAGENLPEKLLEIGHNMMVGLLNGIIEGSKKVIQFVKDLANTIIYTFKSLLKIHSPSQEFYYLGEMIPLGLANGIEDNKNVAQVAMSNLAKDILALSTKVIKNKVDFGILDIKQEYQEWKKVSRLFTQGSEQYNQAIENMEEARKSANLKILELQRAYNDSLDTTIDKIANMYGLFDEVNLGGGKNAKTILKNLDQQVAKMSEWAEAQDMIAGLNLDETLKAELASMGVAEVNELEAIANMTSDELSTLNDMWVKKQGLANDTAVKQMSNFKDKTLNEIKKLKDGIDGETIDIEDVGGRLIEHISEGITGALPTLDSAYAQLGDYIAEAQRQLASSAGGSDTVGGDGLNVPDAGGQLLQQIQGNLENVGTKLKDMIPKMLLGIVGAWGLTKILPKVFGMIANKINVKGIISGALQGVFSRAATGATKGAGKDALLAILDDYIFNTDDKSLKARVLERLRNKVTGAEIPEAMEEAVKSTTKAAKPAKVLAESSQSISGSIQTTNQSFSKVSSVFDSIKKGAQTIMWIAGAIAAVAGALWVTYNALKEVDFEKLGQQLGAMAGAVALFGTLAGIAQHIGLDWKGILVIAGIAADIALVALACRGAYELMKDIPWDGFGSMIGMMAAAIGTFGALNAILGIKVIAIAEGLGLLVSAGIVIEMIAVAKSCREAYDTMKDMNWDAFSSMLKMMALALGAMGALNAPLGAMIVLETLGWASVSMICDELIKVAKALVVVNDSIPEDFSSLEKKLGYIKLTLEKINGLDLGTVIGMMVTSWSAGPVERIVSMYAYVAEQLNKIGQVELNGDAIDANLNYIKSVLENIKAKNDVISGWLETSALDMEASSVENAGRIVIVYGDMVDALDKLANFTPNEQAITGSLTKMVGVIALLRNSSYGSGGIFNIFSNMGTIAGDVEKIKEIVKNYLEMVPTFQDLGKDENKISDDLSTTVQTNIGNIKDIVYEIGSVDTAGYIDTKENDIKKIQSILNNFKEMIPTFQSLKDVDTDFGGWNFGEGYTGVRKKIEDIKELVLAIGEVDTGGWIDQKESDMNKIQSILNKFTEVAKTTQLLDQYPLAGNATTWVQNVRNLVWEIGQINQSESGSLDAKAEIVEKSKTILTKLMEFSNLMKDFESTDKSSMIQMLTDNLYQLTVNVQNTLSEQASGFENVGNQLGQSLANGIKAVDFAGAGNEIQSKIWHAIDSRMNDEYYQGRSMGERFRQGLYEIDYGNAGWWAVQGFINGAWGRAGSSDGVYNTGWWIADRFLKGLKDRGEQGSPWKTTIESGSWAVEGLIEGIKSSESALVGEATNLADEVVNALTMDDLTLSPELNARGTYTPTMAIGNGNAYGNNGSVIIEQTNNNYTQYDIEQVQRDLAWELSKT